MRRVLGRGVVVVAALLGLSGAAGAGRGGPVDRLPDLVSGRLYGFTMGPMPGGRTQLRFGTIGWNVGDGPLEAQGIRINQPDMVMRVRQRIYDTEGGYRDRITPSVMIYDTGDNHDHWHTRQFMVVQLYKRGRPTGSVLGLRKIGYCLVDAARMSNPPPGTPPTGGYPTGSCGSRNSTFVRSGLSIGYGDDYPPQYAHQWMDVSGLVPGTYRICTTVDPLGEFVERVETNNQRWTDIQIDVESRQLSVLGTAAGACGPNVP